MAIKTQIKDNSIPKVIFGRRREGKAVKRRNKHNTSKKYRGQG